MAIIADLADWSGFTWSPKSNRRYDVRKLDQSNALYKELSRGNRKFRIDRPIYLIATTCNTDISVNAVLRRAYEKLMLITNQPLIGYWVDEYGTKHLDTAIQLSQK